MSLNPLWSTGSDAFQSRIVNLLLHFLQQTSKFESSQELYKIHIHGVSTVPAQHSPTTVRYRNHAEAYCDEVATVLAEPFYSASTSCTQLGHSLTTVDVVSSPSLCSIWSHGSCIPFSPHSELKKKTQGEFMPKVCTDYVWNQLTHAQSPLRSPGVFFSDLSMHIFPQVAPRSWPQCDALEFDVKWTIGLFVGFFEKMIWG